MVSRNWIISGSSCGLVCPANEVSPPQPGGIPRELWQGLEVIACCAQGRAPAWTLVGSGSRFYRSSDLLVLLFLLVLPCAFASWTLGYEAFTYKILSFDVAQSINHYS